MANKSEKALPVRFERILHESVCARVIHKAVKRICCIFSLDPVDIDTRSEHGVTGAGFQRFAQRFTAAERGLVHGQQHDVFAVVRVFNRYEPFLAGFSVPAEDKADFFRLAVQRKVDGDLLTDLRRICNRKFVDVGERSGRRYAYVGNRFVIGDGRSLRTCVGRKRFGNIGRFG